MLAELLLKAALAQPAPWYPPTVEAPESPPEYRARLGVLTRAVALETAAPPRGWNRTELAFAVLGNWYQESRFAFEVHAGGEHPVWDQDVGRARCLGQIHESRRFPGPVWRGLAGTTLEATRRCARATIELMAGIERACGYAGPQRVALVLTTYGTGVCAEEVSAAARAKVARIRRMRRATGL